MSYACKTSCAKNIIVGSFLSSKLPIKNLYFRAFYLIYHVRRKKTQISRWTRNSNEILDSKQSKQKKRGCIAMKLVAQMLVKAGLTHLITVDLHQKEIQGFFDIPVDNLRASSFLLDYIQQQVRMFSLDFLFFSNSFDF